MTNPCNHERLLYQLGVKYCPNCKRNIARELKANASRINPSQSCFTYRVMERGEL